MENWHLVAAGDDDHSTILTCPDAFIGVCGGDDGVREILAESGLLADYHRRRSHTPHWTGQLSLLGVPTWLGLGPDLILTVSAAIGDATLTLGKRGRLRRAIPLSHTIAAASAGRRLCELFDSPWFSQMDARIIEVISTDDECVIDFEVEPVSLRVTW